MGCDLLSRLLWPGARHHTHMRVKERQTTRQPNRPTDRQIERGAPKVPQFHKCHVIVFLLHSLDARYAAQNPTTANRVDSPRQIERFSCSATCLPRRGRLGAADPLDHIGCLPQAQRYYCHQQINCLPANSGGTADGQVRTGSRGGSGGAS